MSFLHAIAESWMANKYTAMPAKVVRYDFENQCVDIIPCINVIDPDEKTEEPRPTVPAVPIVFPCSSTSAITFPIKVGDYVLAVWSMRPVHLWKQNGSGSPEDLRKFDIQDAFAIPCTFPRNQTKTRYGQSPDDLVLIHNLGENQTELHLKASGDIVANTPTKFQINCNQLEINASSTQINSPVTTNSSVTATGDVVGAGISLSTHVHGGVVVGGSNTSGPQ
jgi:hypothetical protein